MWDMWLETGKSIPFCLLYTSVFRKGKGKVQRVRLQAWHGAGTAVQTDGTLGKAGTA